LKVDKSTVGDLRAGGWGGWGEDRWVRWAWGRRAGDVVGRRLTARFMEGGELGVVGMMAGPSSVKDGYIVIEHFGNTYKYR
jgi:hypothetical protein